MWESCKGLDMTKFTKPDEIARKKIVFLYFNTAAYWYYNFCPSLPLMKREGRP